MHWSRRKYLQSIPRNFECIWRWSFGGNYYCGYQVHFYWHLRLIEKVYVDSGKISFLFQHYIWRLLGPHFFHIRWNYQRTHFICNLHFIHDYSKRQALRSKRRGGDDQAKNVSNFGSSPPNRSFLRSWHVDQIRIQAIRLDPNEISKA